MTHRTPTPAEVLAHTLQHSFLMHPITAEHYTRALLDALATAGFGTYNIATHFACPRVATQDIAWALDDCEFGGDPLLGDTLLQDAQIITDALIAAVEGKP